MDEFNALEELDKWLEECNQKMEALMREAMNGPAESDSSNTEYRP